MAQRVVRPISTRKTGHKLEVNVTRETFKLSQFTFDDIVEARREMWGNFPRDIKL